MSIDLNCHNLCCAESELSYQCQQLTSPTDNGDQHCFNMRPQCNNFKYAFFCGMSSALGVAKDLLLYKTNAAAKSGGFAHAAPQPCIVKQTAKSHPIVCENNEDDFKTYMQARLSEAAKQDQSWLQTTDIQGPMTTFQASATAAQQTLCEYAAAKGYCTQYHGRVFTAKVIQFCPKSCNQCAEEVYIYTYIFFCLLFK